MMQPKLPIPNNTGIAIVAPGGYPADESALARAVAWFEQQGCVVHNYYDPSVKYQRFGGTEQVRVAQLYAAANDPDVQIVMPVRGGYGMSRILPMLDIEMLAQSGKLFVGHSDFTALQMALLAECGAGSFAGPMAASDFGKETVSQFMLEHFWNCLTRPSYSLTVATENNPSINVEGQLWGGNLAMLTHLLGSKYFPQIENGILFVEDINEHPYRVERMLLQLLYAGVLGKQQAILLGDFSNYRLSDYDNGYDFGPMLAYLRSCVATPILTGLPFGHIDDKATLPVGCQASLISEKKQFTLTMSAYPALREVR